MKSLRYLPILLMLFFIGCSGNSEEAIFINDFYKEHLANPDFRTTEKSVLSPELSDLINKTVQKENSSTQPSLFIGNIFASNNGVATSYKVTSVSTNENLSTVKVEFKNSNAEPKIQWNDDIYLLKDVSGWKIDNVVYGDNSTGAKDLKQKLNNYINQQDKMPGSDKDNHGCLASAGYRWSTLKKKCIRSFELPLQLTNADNTFAAGVIFSDDKKQAEIFTKDGAQQLSQKSVNAFSGSEITLEQKSGKWILSDLKGNILYSEK